MRLLLQRVSRASVQVEGATAGRIGPGLLALAGFAANDADETLRAMLRKALNLRVFDDGEGKMNRSLLEVRGGLLVVSQFTLYADCRKGRRPSYLGAAPPPLGRELYGRFLAMAAAEAESAGLPPVEAGIFGAMMDVSLQNDGPVTVWLDSAELFPPAG
jgi:D-tyrosyl-tRNA(Tyr) deacylase